MAKVEADNLMIGSPLRVPCFVLSLRANMKEFSLGSIGIALAEVHPFLIQVFDGPCLALIPEDCKVVTLYLLESLFRPFIGSNAV